MKLNLVLAPNGIIMDANYKVLNKTLISQRTQERYLTGRKECIPENYNDNYDAVLKLSLPINNNLYFQNSFNFQRNHL